MVAYPDAEKALFNKFVKMREEGWSTKRWWFNSRITKLVQQFYPTANFKHSDRWFSRFCKRYRIALRRKTHVAQKLLADNIMRLKEFHQYLNHVCRVGKYDLRHLANMDQAPMPFILDDGTTYEHQGSKDVCCKSSAPGLEKRQSTAQITLFTDGIPCVKPLLIFKGKGLRISAEEKKVWDSRVTVFFQENAWCDEQTMVNWIRSEWNHFFLNPSTPGSDGKILVTDTSSPTDGKCEKITCQMQDKACECTKRLYILSTAS